MLLQLEQQEVERRLGVFQGGRFLRQRTADGNAGLGQIHDPVQHVIGHGPAVRSQDQHLVFHPGFRLQAAVDREHGVLEAIRVDEVVGIAGRNLGQLRSEQPRNAVVLAVIVKDIGLETALLEKIGTAGEIVRPDPRLFRPGLVPVEPLAETEQVQAGPVRVVRLVGGLVDDETVQAAGEGDIGRIFQVFRAVGVAFPAHAAGGEGFRGDDVLAEEMSHGGRFPDIGHRHRDRGSVPGIGRPDGGHRDVGEPFDVHAVSDKDPSVFVGFRIAALHSGVPGDVAQAVVILGEEFAEGLPPVEQELFRLFRAAENLARQGRQPREEVIPPPFLELLEHVLCPCHLPGLVAVRQDILDRGAFIDAEEFPEIGFPGLRIEFVHLKTRRLGRSRMVLLAGQGDAETIDAPSTFRHLPDKESTLVHQTEILDLGHGIGRVRRQIIGEIVRRGKTRFVLRMIHFDDAVQDEFRNLGPSWDTDRHAEPHKRTVRLRIPDHQPEMPGACRGNVHRQDRQDIGGDVTHPPPGLAVIAGFQAVTIGGRVVSPDASRFAARQGQGADRLRLVEGILDPGLLSLGSGRQFQVIVEIPVGELLDRKPAAGRCHFRAHLSHRLFRGGQFDREGTHMAGPRFRIPAVRDVLIGSGGIEERRHPEDLDTRSFDFDRPPGELFHRILGLHPRTARGTPARSRRHGRFHPLCGSQFHRIAHRHLPLGRVVRHLFIDDGGHPDPARIELMETADAGPFHPLDVLQDAVHGHVAIHPMPPHPRSRFLRRLPKPLIHRALRPDTLRQGQRQERHHHFFHTCKDNLFFEKPPEYRIFVSRIQVISIYEIRVRQREISQDPIGTHQGTYRRLRR